MLTTLCNFSRRFYDILNLVKSSVAEMGHHFLVVCTRVETKIFVFVFSRKMLTKSYGNNENFREN
jgi:hypothetical protein